MIPGSQHQRGSYERVAVQRSGRYLYPDNSRVLLRPFLPGGEKRARDIIGRILANKELEMVRGLDYVLQRYSHDCKDIRGLFFRRCDELEHLLPPGVELTPTQRLLIGGYFTSEYSLQSAALFNPSIVPHPNQEGAPPGTMRFVMSLRVIGEGHISSIEFREGLISEDGVLTYKAVSPCVTSPPIQYLRQRKEHLLSILTDLGLDSYLIDVVLNSLDEEFDVVDLAERLRHPEEWGCPVGKGMFECEIEQKAVRDAVLWTAESNYMLEFSNSLNLSERVIFPSSRNERGGIEDARFVRFSDEDGHRLYYATYTAFDGAFVLPHLIETEDFRSFRLRPMRGAAARDKGMALFPRKIDGKYVMLGRQGGSNLSIMFSDDVYHWEEYETLLEPEEPWQFVQIGNCGSPIETEAGWLVLTHGVGAVRNYCIGAALLDLKNPRKVIGRLRVPLIEPEEDERDGYVPNVVYSCGSLVHNGWLILPYAVSDYATTDARVRLDELLKRLVTG